MAIRTAELSRSFGPVVAVDRLSLEVPAGSVFGFLGPNGAGKTTTIRLLLGLLEPTGGQAQVLSLDTRTEGDGIRAQTGALLEYAGLYERLSAADNLEFFGRVAHLPAPERRARIEGLLRHVGLWDRRGEVVARWSRGMKQKLAMARALLHRPRLLFLDEPTAGLDPVAAVALREDLAGLAVREGVTVFLTTHNLAEAEKLCSLVAVIREGRLLAVGRPGDLRAQRAAGTQRVVVTGRGFDGGNDDLLARVRTLPDVLAARVENGRLTVDLREGAESSALVGLLVTAGAQVEEVRKEGASLEDVFLTLVSEEAE